MSTDITSYKCYDEDFAQIDSQTVIRFPVDIAQRLNNEYQSSTCLANQNLPMEIEALPDWGYRKFQITIYNEILTGVLVELPCFIESYKTIDDHRLFKSSDISQMIFCYRANDLPRKYLDPESIRVMENLSPLTPETPFLWSSGLTPPTYKIREKKFRYSTWESKLVSDAEDAILRAMEDGKRDGYEVDYLHKDEMEAFMTEEGNNVITNFDELNSDDETASTKLFFGEYTEENEEELDNLESYFTGGARMEDEGVGGSEVNEEGFDDGDAFLTGKDRKKSEKEKNKKLKEDTIQRNKERQRRQTAQHRLLSQYATHMASNNSNV